MAAWAGFSEEELQRLQNNADLTSQAVLVAPGRGRKTAATTNRSRQQLQRERALQQSTRQKQGCPPLPPEQQLSKPAEAIPASPLTPAATKQELLVQHEAEPAEIAPTSPADALPTSDVKELNKLEVELREKNRLEQLQWEQRIMEEKNKKRKALLTKTIAEKSKQTQAEAVKLKKIQKELQALDDSVSNDIGILRKLIEQSSMDYSLAWKRFEKAEAEYVCAKLDLHRKTEVKEQLTEHLCAIIQQNELRKARKLDELMLQLQLNAEEVHLGPEETDLKAEEKEQCSQTVTEMCPAAESSGCPQLDGSSITSRDGSSIEQNSQDNPECKETDVTADGPS